MSDETNEIIIDFTSLNEMAMNQMAAQVQRLMSIIMTGTYYPATIKGTPMQVDRFTHALSAEKDYVISYNKHGLDNPATYKSRYRLDGAVKNFEKDTGLVWPFK